MWLKGRSYTQSHRHYCIVWTTAKNITNRKKANLCNLLDFNTKVNGNKTLNIQSVRHCLCISCSTKYFQSLEHDHLHRQLEAFMMTSPTKTKRNDTEWRMKNEQRRKKKEERRKQMLNEKEKPLHYSRLHVFVLMLMLMLVWLCESTLNERLMVCRSCLQAHHGNGND